MTYYEGDLRTPDKARYAIIASRWNPRIADALVEGARRAFADNGVAADAV
ncbi:MAG TPA: 6,7-dimethyl-8-ribityllumazine synthase, partial [Xanthomonadaceae bacterium]|nr:6,7-dimethyl-8-ribityllumazine synthase [Xanthomonadaceae bacterium]